ncbi:hypothetical protein ABIA69_001338 [Lysinibacillus parviboronicapiens]|uniref:Uncharacterized protein n=1 Tax=Lysinibacillus parviboronicapiens TaxID=436516 RepID=A0ABV2PHW0_9BACI
MTDSMKIIYGIVPEVTLVRGFNFAIIVYITEEVNNGTRNN